MRRIRFLRPPRETDLKLRHEQAEGPQKLVPWWARAMRQLGVVHTLRRQQPRGSLNGNRAPRVNITEPAVYARRSVV